MAKHKIKVWGRTDDGQEVELLLPSLARLVECIVEVDGVQTVMPLDELLLDYAEEINGIVADLPGKADLVDGKVPLVQLPEGIGGGSGGGSGGVESFNGRTRDITPQSGDYTAAMVGARPGTWTPTAADVGAVPTSRTVNGKALTGNISLTAADVGALASGGTATAATQLATARTFRTNLASTSTASFNGTGNATPGVTGILGMANGGTGIFVNKTVATSAWATNTTYADFGFRASVACTGVTADMMPNVVFSPADALSGNFAPVADCYAGGVYIYATEKPTVVITIPTITATGVK